MLSIRCKMLLENFANIILISRENWLSPLIRATWEARTVRWREVEGLRLGTVHRGGQAPVTRGGQVVTCCSMDRPGASPSPNRSLASNSQTQFS